ncbi:MAG: GNAT family N-acetyltransferase [Desulfobacteraceae bacterium]|nr:GNAT family N-acetyltransferase [Desulfobacteraceae bacterium]
MFITRPVNSWQDTLDQMTLWRTLHHQLAPDNPFVSPLWSEIWFNTHLEKKQRKTFLLTATNEGAEGIILLSKGRTQRFKLPVKSIESIGAGRSATDRHFVSEQEPLLTKRATSPLLESIKAFKDWAFFRLAPLSADYPFFEEFITAAERHGLTAFRRPYSIGYKIKTDMGWEAYEKSRSKNLRKSIRVAYKKMQKSGVFRIEAHTDADSAGHLLCILNKVSMNSWKVEAGSDIFNPVYRGFWEKAFLDTLAAGQTTLWVLYYRDQPVGYEWYLQQGRRMFGLKTDYDEEYARFSPGTLLKLHTLQKHFETGASEIDFLMGGGDYKKRWATDSYQLDELLIFNQSLYSRIWYNILSRQDQIKALYQVLNRARLYFK